MCKSIRNNWAFVLTVFVFMIAGNHIMSVDPLINALLVYPLLCYNTIITKQEQLSPSEV